MSIADNIKRLRAKTHYSQQDIADKLAIDRKTYVSWENGTTHIKDNFIPKIAEIFEVEIADLFKTKTQPVVSIGGYKLNHSIGIFVLTDSETSEKLTDILKNILDKTEE
jgi:DNA-binding XRE family transcriptional regulator